MSHRAAPVSPGVPDDSFALLTVQDGDLNWAGLALGMTRSQAERQLGMALPIEAMESPACGTIVSQTAVAERAVAIQWSGDSAEASVQSITVTLAPGESRLDADKLAKRAIRAVPTLKSADTERKSKAARVLVMTNHADRVLLLKSDEFEHLFYLSLANCLD